jgi:hypothetical protein
MKKDRKMVGGLSHSLTKLVKSCIKLASSPVDRPPGQNTASGETNHDPCFATRGRHCILCSPFIHGSI